LRGEEEEDLMISEIEVIEKTEIEDLEDLLKEMDLEDQDMRTEIKIERNFGMFPMTLNNNVGIRDFVTRCLY